MHNAANSSHAYSQSCRGKLSTGSSQNMPPLAGRMSSGGSTCVAGRGSDAAAGLRMTAQCSAVQCSAVQCSAVHALQGGLANAPIIFTQPHYCSSATSQQRKPPPPSAHLELPSGQVGVRSQAAARHQPPHQGVPGWRLGAFL